MFWDDLRRLLGGPTLYRLDGLIGARLVPLLNGFGLAAIGLWVIDHLFASFSFNFGQGLWGILEVLVYGPLWALLLRIACELVLIFFKAHEASAAAVNRGRARTTLLEDVGAAIHDLADGDDGFSSAGEPPPYGGAAPLGGAATMVPGPSAASTSTAPAKGVDVDPIIKATTPRRTARRTPKP